MCLLCGYQLFKFFFKISTLLHSYLTLISSHPSTAHTELRSRSTTFVLKFGKFSLFSHLKNAKMVWNPNTSVFFVTRGNIIIIIVEKFTFSVHLNKSWIFVKLYLVCTQQAQNGEYPKVENFAWTPGENIWRDDSWGICIGSYVSPR